MNPLNFFKRTTSNKKGFTLIELLVVTAIISLMSTLMLANYRAGERQFAFQSSVHKLAQDLRRTQEMAMSAQEFGGGVPAGYGIYLHKGDTYYLLYADTNPGGGNEKYDGGDATVETIYLEKRVYIKDLSTPASMSINFKPPDPKTKISGDGSEDTGIITLSLETDPTPTTTIKINKAGLITVE